VWNVAKMLLCRNGLGYHEYICPECGSTKRIPHTCKSRFCPSCGKVAKDRWVDKVDPMSRPIFAFFKLHSDLVMQDDFALLCINCLA